MEWIVAAVPSFAGIGGGSDCGLELGDVTGIVEAGRDLILGQVGKLSHDLVGVFSACELSQYQANWNTSAFDPRLPMQELRIAGDVLFPVNWHKVVRRMPKSLQTAESFSRTMRKSRVA